MTDLLQWAMLIFMAAGAVALFAIAADVLSRCPELQNQIEMLADDLCGYYPRSLMAFVDMTRGYAFICTPTSQGNGIARYYRYAD